MKKIRGLVLLFFTMSLRAQMAVYDVTAQVDRNKATLMQKAHQAVMENEMVLQTKMIIQNYQEGQKHYAMMKKIQEHKGGVVGYYKEQTVDRFKGIDREFLAGIQKDMLSDSTMEEREKVGQKWFLDTHTKEFDKYVEEKMDFTEEIEALFEKRKKREQNIIENASANAETYDELFKAQAKLKKAAEALKTQNDYDQWNAQYRMMQADLLSFVGSMMLQESLNKIADDKDAEKYNEEFQFRARQELGNFQAVMDEDRDPRKKYNPLYELKRTPQEERR